MAKTLFQAWCDRIHRGHSPTEMQFWNPVNITVGASLQLDVLDHRDLTFNVVAISVYTRTIRGHTYEFADYDIVGGDQKLRLRYYPRNETSAAGDKVRVVMLHLTDDMEYNADLHNALKADTGEFQIFNDKEQLESQWFRVDDVRGAYNAQVAYVADANQDGKVTDAEVTHENLEYWDFNRQIKSEGGNDVIEYLFIEIASATHWIKQWQGPEIATDQVNWFK